MPPQHHHRHIHHDKNENAHPNHHQNHHHRHLHLPRSRSTPTATTATTTNNNPSLLSAANIIGVVLFITYIGTSLFSFIHHSFVTGSPSPSPAFGASPALVGALYTSRKAELAYCKYLDSLNRSPYPTPCTNTTNATRTNKNNKKNNKKRLYLQPYGGLGNRLRAVASALTLAHVYELDVVIVWTDKEYGFRGHFHDLFVSPRIPVGCFPGRTVREDRARCSTVHRINDYTEFENLIRSKDAFQRVPVGEDDDYGTVVEVLCMQSMMFLTRKQRDIEWFYKLLVPSQPIQDTIRTFQKKVGWDSTGSWIGMHIRRTDLRLLCRTDTCLDGLSATEVLPLTAYTQVVDRFLGRMGASGHHNHKREAIRIFIATDDENSEDFVRSCIKNRTSVESLKKEIRDGAKDSIEMRDSVSGTMEGVADLWLLSQTKVLLGTVGSSYSQTAKMMSHSAFFLTIGVEFENKL